MASWGRGGGGGSGSGGGGVATSSPGKGGGGPGGRGGSSGGGAWPSSVVVAVAWLGDAAVGDVISISSSTDRCDTRVPDDVALWLLWRDSRRMWWRDEPCGVFTRPISIARALLWDRDVGTALLALEERWERVVAPPRERWEPGVLGVGVGGSTSPVTTPGEAATVVSMGWGRRAPMAAPAVRTDIGVPPPSSPSPPFASPLPLPLPLPSVSPLDVRRRRRRI